MPGSPSGQSSLISISTKNISKRFSKSGEVSSVLQDISFDVETGKILAIVGKSGIGKTTLLNIVSGLEQADLGSVESRGSIGYMPQKDLLLPWRTTIANVLLPIEIQKGDLWAATLRARQFFQKHGLSHFENAYPSEISGGMRQKISLMRVFLQDPDTILFDEPFSAIDADARLQLVKDVRLYITSSRKSAIFVTHNIEEAIAVSDKLIVLGEQPATIIYQTDIVIPDEYRDPVSVRKSDGFQDLFERIWELIGKQI